jgi:hypothetical protein
MMDYDNDDLIPRPSKDRDERVYDGRDCVSLGELNLKEYKPKKQDILKEYEIRIKFLSVGCIVSVGCKEIPFRSVKEAMEELNKYVDNPYEEGKKWNELFNSED